MNIPNVLTAVRFIITPVFGYCLGTGQYILALILFSLGGITDVLDGYIARKYNLITSFGKLADPLADKLMQLTALVVLSIQGVIPTVFLIIILAKESFMGLGSLTLYKKENIVVSANWYGKLSTVIFYFVIVTAIILKQMDLPFSRDFTDIAAGIAVAFAVFAFVMYSMEYKKMRTEN